jgi:hypothetical protein
MKLQYLALTIALFIPAIGFSAEPNPAAIWHQAKVDRVYPTADGNFVLVMAKDSDACPSTTTPDYYKVSNGRNSVTPEGVRNMLSVALTAAAQGKQLSINFDSTDSHCYINRIQIRYDQ